MTKVCLDCQVEKPLDQFHKAGKYHRGFCKPCRSIRRKEYSNGRVGKLAARKAHLQARYGITLEQYDSMRDGQQGKCAICKSQAELHVDHCHTGGQVRGLLCGSCNKGLGLFKDNPESLRVAITYLGH